MRRSLRLVLGAGVVFFLCWAGACDVLDPLDAAAENLEET
jgi:hypothetical protein